MKHGIYWFVSYPKSGNTWMRAIISNYIANLDEPIDINSFSTDSIFSNRKLFDDNLCISSSDLSMDEIQLYQADAYREFLKNSNKDLYIKVHDAYTYNKENQLLFPKEITKGVLYIIRNPLDVVVSYSFHNGATIEKTITNLNEDNFVVSKSINKLSSQLPQKMLSWSKHVESWINCDLPLRVIRYEDMIENSYETFHKALTFLGFDVEEIRLRKAIEFSSFKNLKKQENEKEFKEKPEKAESFFRSGKIGDFKNHLSEEEIELIKLKLNKIMKEFNY